MRVVPFVIAILIAAGAAFSAEEIHVRAGRNRTAIKLTNEAEGQLAKGDLEGASRSVEAAIRMDPTLWSAFCTRAKLRMKQHKWELAIQDCNEVLRQKPSFALAASLRAEANRKLGRYAASLKELDHVVSIQPSEQFYAIALNQRAWLRATCPDSSFRNGQLAIRDAEAACNLSAWKDPYIIDTLSAAYAETGDFDAAVRFEEKALTIGEPPEGMKELRQHMDLFKQHHSFHEVQANERKSD